jgi:hypothetical protein
MTDDDDDIRAALALAHEPAPPFDETLGRRRRPARIAYAVVGVAVAAAAVAVAVVAWPASEPTPAPPVALDLTSPELTKTSLVMPLDSLLDVPELATLGTLPQLGTGGDLP